MYHITSKRCLRALLHTSLLHFIQAWIRLVSVVVHFLGQVLMRFDGTENNGSYAMDSSVVGPEQVQSWASDSIEAERLWTLSEELVGQKFDY